LHNLAFDLDTGCVFWRPNASVSRFTGEPRELRSGSV
jgi:hypothetical protein